MVARSPDRVKRIPARRLGATPPNDPAQQRRGKLSYEYPETNLAPAVCCSAWFGAHPPRPRLGRSAASPHDQPVDEQDEQGTADRDRQAPQVEPANVPEAQQRADEAPDDRADYASTMVRMIPPPYWPGMMNFASAPAIRPNTTHATIPITTQLQ